MSLAERRRLEKRADELFSRYVRLRDQACRRCGSVEVLQCAHVISRRYRGTRWDPVNAIALCRRCHAWQTHHPLEGDDWFRSVLGARVFGNLRLRALAGGKGVDLQALVVWLRQEIAGFEALDWT